MDIYWDGQNESLRAVQVNREFAQCTRTEMYFPLKFNYKHLTLTHDFMHANMNNTYQSLQYIRNSPWDALYIQIQSNRYQAQSTDLLGGPNINGRSIHNKEVWTGLKVIIADAHDTLYTINTNRTELRHLQNVSSHYKKTSLIKVGLDFFIIRARCSTLQHVMLHQLVEHKNGVWSDYTPADDWTHTKLSSCSDAF